MNLLLGTRKGLIHFAKDKGKWNFVRHSFLGTPVSYAAVDPRNGMWWACLDHGHWGQKLHRSKDAGVTWEEVPAPKYPEGEEVKAGVPATLRYLWVFQHGGVDQPQRLYLGTEPGGLFRSDDGGDTWELVRSLWDQPSRKEGWFGGGRDHAGIHSVVVDPRDSRRVLIGISCAGVFETRDDGATWKPLNRGLRADFMPDPYAEIGHDPHFLAASTGHPDALWQQNHCGIFRSADGGANWQDVSETGGPARFGFAISADPHDPLTAWVVPAVADETRVAFGNALCVCRTRDGGKTWERLSKGLPQELCYDIVYRHALDQHGDTLAFGSTTGNAFISADRGETWESLGSYLPPIYSVRFSA